MAPGHTWSLTFWKGLTAIPGDSAIILLRGVDGLLFWDYLYARFAIGFRVMTKAGCKPVLVRIAAITYLGSKAP